MDDVAMLELPRLGGARLRNRAVDLPELEIHAGGHGSAPMPCMARLLIGRASCDCAAQGGLAARIAGLRDRSLLQRRLWPIAAARANVLDGPVSALRHLVGLLAQDPRQSAAGGRRNRHDGNADPRSADRTPGETWTTQLARNSAGRDRLCASPRRLTPRPRCRTWRRRAPRARLCRPRPRTGRR